MAQCLQAPRDAGPAFDLLYRRHAPAVLAFLYGMHRGDAEAARDALQETFLRCWAGLGGFNKDRPLRPWLLRIARNVALDHLKRKSTTSEQATEPGAIDGRVSAATRDPAEAAARREAAALLRSAIYALPPEERAVFLLRHDQELTYAEVADALGCSVRTAKYRMKAALERIAQAAERLGVTA